MIPRLPLADVAWIARMMLGLTFLASGVAKVRDIDGVVVGVLRYEIGPPRVMRRLAPLLPAAELRGRYGHALSLKGTSRRAPGQPERNR
jgi:hypothetical protein